jgi:trimeric autotransporter adhesin
MKKTGLGFASLTLIALILPGRAFCQASSAERQEAAAREESAPATTTVAGAVRTAQGVLVPGAMVRVVHVASGKSWVTWTDEEGLFSFPNLLAGHYRLEAKILGFALGQGEADFAGATSAGAQLTLHVEVPSVSVKSVIRETATPETPASPDAPLPENKGGAALAAESSPAGGGKPEGRSTAASTASSGPTKSKKSAQDQPLSAAGAAPSDESSPLGDASSANAFLMGGSVNRSSNLGGPGSFGTVGGSNGTGGVGSSATDSFQFPGQDDTSTGKHSHRGLKGKKKKAQQQQVPSEAENFGQGIEQLWAQHRLSRLSSDQLHFSFVNRLDNSVWDARPFDLVGTGSPKISNHDERFSAHVGGPLYIPHVFDGRQRTFFFFSYELERATQPLDFFATVPTLAERGGDFTDVGAQLFDPTSSLTGPRVPLGSKIPQNRLDPAAVQLLQFYPLPNLPGFVQNFHLQAALPTNSDMLNFKVLHTISPRLNLSASYQNKTSSGINAFTMPQLTNNSSIEGQALNVVLAQNWTSRLINETRVNWSSYTTQTQNAFAFNRNVVAELGINGVSDAPVDWGVPTISLQNYDPLLDTIPVRQNNQTLRVMDNLSYILSKHTIRTGAEVRFIQLNSNTNPNPRGSFNFTGLMTSQLDNSGLPIAGTGLDFADFLMGFPQSTALQFGSSSNNFREREYIGYLQDDWRIHPRFAVNFGVRYEMLTPPADANNRIANLVVNPGITAVALVCASPGVSPLCQPGLVDPFTGKALPRSLVYTDTNNWAPRIGIAWRPSAKLPMVVRAGYAIFYNESVFNQLAQSLTNQPPYAQTMSLQTTTQTVLTLQNGFPTQLPTTLTNTVAINPNYQVGNVQVWNLAIEAQPKPSLAIELTYTGTKGTNLDLLRAPNRATPGSPFNTDISRRIPNVLGFTYDTFGASSIYHAGQLLVHRQMSHGLMIEGWYTYSRSIDNASSIGGGSTLAVLLGAVAGGNARAATPVVVQNDNNFRAERGRSSFDVTQAFRSQFSYALPFGPTKTWLHHGWASAVLGNLQASGITIINTGMPFTALLSGNLSDNTGTGIVNSSRPDQIASADLPRGQRTSAHFFNTAAFTIPPPLQFGDASRNTITGPGTFVVNFALQKKFKYGEDDRIHLDVRWEVQNLTNTASFAGLRNLVDSDMFGHVSAVKPMRTMDLMLRMSF